MFDLPLSSHIYMCIERRPIRNELCPASSAADRSYCAMSPWMRTAGTPWYCIKSLAKISQDPELKNAGNVSQTCPNNNTTLNKSTWKNLWVPVVSAFPHQGSLHFAKDQASVPPPQGVEDLQELLGLEDLQPAGR